MTMEIITVMGPELYRSEIPPKMAEYCPGDFKFFAIKQVQANSHNVHPQEDGGILIGDPRLQKDVEYGDIADFSDLFQVLPKKRSARVRRCVVDGQTVPSCHYTEINCSLGCSASNTFFNCRPKGQNRSCEYFLRCQKLMVSNFENK